MRAPVEKAPAVARITEPETIARSGSAAKALEAAFIAFLQARATVLPIDRRIFLTMTEAAEFSGLPAVFLRRLMTSGKLKALKTGAGWRIARVELERLAGTLTETPKDLTEHELRDLEMNKRRRQGIAFPPGASV